MTFPVIKGTAYALVHTPTMLIHLGTTQTVERAKNPDSEYLKKIPAHLRSFDAAVAYPPNQVYVGNMTPDQLGQIARPWYEKPVADAGRDGRYGEMMPEDEFYGLMKISDVFDLVMLEDGFHGQVKAKLEKHALITEADLKRLGNGVALADIQKAVSEAHAEPLYIAEQLVGCVKRAHDVDAALTAHVMTENLVAKASATLVFKNLLAKTDLKAEDVEYIIECSEEACGDMNQRGGGNFAKAIGEMVHCVKATGSDMRGFCAGPAHAMVAAAALVKAGVYKNVVVVAGGATAKLGMNGRDHVNKGLPLLEDMIGAFAFHIGENDGVNPVIRTDVVGRHVIGSGSSPQAVMQALVTDPLEHAGLKIVDIDRYSAEMQNPEITEPAGAGDVPKANYKMIAALGVKKGELQRTEIESFGLKHGMPGFAPTQGHIPSGVPFLGHARDAMMAKKLNKAMIIGKGSLFLGRMTNLFDGVSFVIEANSGKAEETKGVSKDEIRGMIAEAMRDFASSLLK